MIGFEVVSNGHPKRVALFFLIVLSIVDQIMIAYLKSAICILDFSFAMIISNLIDESMQFESDNKTTTSHNSKGDSV